MDSIIEQFELEEVSSKSPLLKKQNSVSNSSKNSASNEDRILNDITPASRLSIDISQIEFNSLPFPVQKKNMISNFLDSERILQEESEFKEDLGGDSSQGLTCSPKTENGKFFFHHYQQRSQDRKAFSVSLRECEMRQPKKHKSVMMDQMSLISNYLSSESNNDLNSKFRYRRRSNNS